MIAWMSYVDYFAVGPKLHYKNSTKHTTVLGGILSIIC